MDFTGRRKYSVPRFASARGEEAARRAMPTSSVAGFLLRSGTGGGAEASLGDSQLPWRAAVGKSVRLVCFGFPGWRRSVAGVGRRVGEVAIVDLAARSQYIRLVFALSSINFCFLFAYSSHLTLTPGKPGRRRPSCERSSRYTEWALF